MLLHSRGGGSLGALVHATWPSCASWPRFGSLLERFLMDFVVFCTHFGVIFALILDWFCTMSNWFWNVFGLAFDTLANATYVKTPSNIDKNLAQNRRKHGPREIDVHTMHVFQYACEKDAFTARLQLDSPGLWPLACQITRRSMWCLFLLDWTGDHVGRPGGPWPPNY